MYGDTGVDTRQRMGCRFWPIQGGPCRQMSVFGPLLMVPTHRHRFLGLVKKRLVKIYAVLSARGKHRAVLGVDRPRAGIRVVWRPPFDRISQYESKYAIFCLLSTPVREMLGAPRSDDRFGTRPLGRGFRCNRRPPCLLKWAAVRILSEIEKHFENFRFWRGSAFVWRHCTRNARSTSKR